MEDAQTDAQRRKDQQAAQETLDELLRQTRPKNFRQGVFQGFNNVVSGAVGAVGIAVLAPTAGFAMGLEQGGFCCGLCGCACGACVGACGATFFLLNGLCGGLNQVCRGCFAIPESIVAPSQGKWWDENDGEWVYTDLSKTREDLLYVPDDDDDILGEARKKSENTSTGNKGGRVKETHYYDVLQVDPAADQSQIRKKYYVLARKYHPDRVGTGDKTAAEKFKDVSEAYQVLSDPDLRSKYDKEGKGGLSPDKTSSASAKMDPVLLFAFLFGSDKFSHYIGMLSTAISASIADSPDISQADARKLQKRRCSRLALKLAERLDRFVYGDIGGAKAAWQEEANILVKASYGYELLRLIGQIYSIAAVHFLGSMESGIGLPSVSEWALSHVSEWKKYNKDQSAKRETMFAGLSVMQMQLKFESAMAEASSDAERASIEQQFQQEMTGSILRVMWTTTVVDVTSTLHETCQMVLFDQSVNNETRKTRGKALKALGDLFLKVPKPSKGLSKDNAQKLYEEAAFAAMLETIKRKDQEAYNAAHPH